MNGNAAIYLGPTDKPKRLAELGLTEELLLRAVRYGQQFGFDCTDNDAPSAIGILIWDKTIRPLREDLIPLGWTRNNARNYATVVNPTKAFAIATAGGDARTGRRNETPTTRAEKGPATRDAILRNQLSFAMIAKDQAEKWPDPSLCIETWILLYYVDESDEEIRAELSLPWEMSVEGQVASWRERIILNATPTNRTTTLPEPLSSGPFDFNVGLKAG
jgi:hypothetical protein